MNKNLAPGTRQEVEFLVDESMVAAFDGRVIHRVLSTFHLVYFAELAARRLIAPNLEEGEDAAGIGVSVNHLAPAKVGDVVTVTATLNRIDGRRIYCDISARNASGKIADGEQTQMLIRKGSLGAD